MVTKHTKRKLIVFNSTFDTPSCQLHCRRWCLRQLEFQLQDGFLLLGARGELLQAGGGSSRQSWPTLAQIGQPPQVRSQDHRSQITPTGCRSQGCLTSPADASRIPQASWPRRRTSAVLFVPFFDTWRTVNKNFARLLKSAKLPWHHNF